MSMVIVALGIVAIVLVAALAIDGGQAYANRRQVQNAADASAMAGTRNFALTRFTATPSIDGVVTEVKRVAGKNGADTGSGQIHCWLVDSQGQTLPATGAVDICNTAGATWASTGASGGAGVKVEASATKGSLLARIGGIDTFSARASATATMQPILGIGRVFPFIACGYSASGLNDILLPEAQGVGVIDPNAVGKLFSLLDSGSNNSDTFKRCGTQSNPFKGKSDGTPASIGTWAGTDTGNSPPKTLNSGDNSQLGSEACPSNSLDFNGCLLIVPIASVGRDTGSSTEVYIVTFAVFRTWGSTTGPAPTQCDPLGPPTPKYCGVLVGGQVGDIDTGTGEVSQGEAYAIKLFR